MGLRARPPAQRTRLSETSLLSLVVALGSAQLGLLTVVDCEASVVGASVLGCSVGVSRPHVLGGLRGSPVWLLWLAVLAGYSLAAVCALFFAASLAHWLRLRLGAPGPPPAGAPPRASDIPTGPRRAPTPRIAESMAEYAARADAQPMSWNCAPLSPAPMRHTPSTAGRPSPHSLGAAPYASRSSPALAGADLRCTPIVDRHSLERYLHGASPLARGASCAAAADGFGGALGTPGPCGGGRFAHVSGGGSGGGAFGGTSPLGPMGGGGMGASPLGQHHHHSPLLGGACCSHDGCGGASCLSPRWASPHTPAGAAACAWTGSPLGGACWSGLSPDAKYHKAMYVPHTGDRLDGALLHAHRASLVLRELRVQPQLLERWRGNVRLWLAAVVLKPLVALARDNDAAIKAEAAQPSAPVPSAQELAAQRAAAGGGIGGGSGGGGGGLFGGFGFGGGGLGLGLGSAAAAKPPTAAAPPPGVPLPPAQWVAANGGHPLVHQRAKLARFWKIPVYAGAFDGAASEGARAAYVKRRTFQLAQGHCLARFCWDGGDGAAAGGTPSANAAAGVGAGARSSDVGGGVCGSSCGGAQWEGGLPTDAEIVMHIFSTFLDAVLVPPPPGVDGRPATAEPSAPAQQPALGGGGGSLFGGGRGFGGGAGGSSLFGCGAWGAPAQPAVAPAPAPARNEAFWVRADEMTSFSSKHLCPPGQPLAEQARSSIVIVKRRSLPGASGACKQAGGGAHYDLLAQLRPWPVRSGENNVFDCVLLLALFVAKGGGVLGRARLDAELHTAFREAMMPRPAEGIDLDHSHPYRPLLSVLEPWSDELEAVQLPAVHAALEANGG
ncbi:hypothetical protein KFE25_009770 [Diacronema lutheri]|uniref:Uncharacterized protein n=2 Tax=Diacronema lutheri TaxID=2081491 RepID=A0A8J5X7R7_DIALT|nr:hypothetical protein KFE25_009770 [Diacronema lutheri]